MGGGGRGRKKGHTLNKMEWEGIRVQIGLVMAPDGLKHSKMMANQHPGVHLAP